MLGDTYRIANAVAKAADAAGTAQPPPPANPYSRRFIWSVRIAGSIALAAGLTWMGAGIAGVWRHSHQGFELFYLNLRYPDQLKLNLYWISFGVTATALLTVFLLFVFENRRLRKSKWGSLPASLRGRHNP